MTTATAWWILPYLDAESLGQSQAEEGFTFQCLGCLKVACLTAEIARLTDIVKRMETIMTKRLVELRAMARREDGMSNAVTRRMREGD